MAYCYQPKSPNEIEKLAFARRENINASFKDLSNVCANIKNRNAKKALEFLEQAAEGLRPVRYFNHNKKRGHIGALGGKKGGYPKKAAKIVLDVLKNAIANANYKGLGECKVIHAVANKQQIFRRLAPKGRRIRHDLETAFVEIVLREIKPKSNLSQSQSKEKPKQEKQEQEKPKEEKPKQEKPKEEQEKPKKQENENQKNENKKEQNQEDQKEQKRKKFSEVLKTKNK